jgi:exosome complex component RRP42
MMLSKLNAKTVEELVKSGTRHDDRGLMDFRPIKVETNYVEKAEGSALVTLGKTKVLVGVKLGLGTPFPDTPDEGILITVAELAPMASPHFEPGPPKPESIELARVVDRVVRESKMIELKKLSIEEEKVWMVNLDFYTLDMDGNLFDAAALGACAALRTTKIPKYEDGKIIREERKTPLPVVDKPISCTFAKIGGKLVIDPTELEEMVMSSRFTIGINQKDHVCAMQKGGFGSFNQAELEQAVEEAVRKAKDLRKVLP